LPSPTDIGEALLVKCNICADFAKIRRLMTRADLRFAKLFDHLGIPQVTDEEVEAALAADPLAHLVKSSTAATIQLSTGESSVHRRAHAALPIRREEPR
jgi:hypothetical protein